MHLRLKDLPSPIVGRSGWPWDIEVLRLPDVRSDGTSWPRISIVTPSFNQGQFVEETIRSILLQGYPNLEYVVMDGGSTDGTIEILRRYERFLTWTSAKDGGQSDAINKGLARSSGKLLAWLNSDDLYLPGALPLVADKFCISKANLLTGGMVSFTGVERTNFILGRAAEFGLRPSIPMLFASSPHLHQSSTFWTKDLWLETGAQLDVSLHYAMDAELWMRFMHAKSVRLAIVDHPLSVFRRHKAQKTAGWHKYSAELDEVKRRYMTGKGRVFSLMVAACRKLRPLLQHRNTHPRLGLKPPGDVEALIALLQATPYHNR